MSTVARVETSSSIQTQRRAKKDGAPGKPRLAFFQCKYDENLPAFLRLHKREHVKCLSEFFAVTVINEDCDYQQVCDQYQPDLTLFESGVSFPSCQRLKISNTQAHPGIPKLGFLHTDAFCWSRAGALSDMAHWGIDTFFSIATTANEHSPALARNLFVWPNFADADTYHDYGMWKGIPILFTGNNTALYPWRKRMIGLVSSHYPSLIWPHPGYLASRSVRPMPAGEEYARLLNTSGLVPACGTVAKEAVRKHFEVPACRTCLITEKSPVLEAAGFVDMTNCVFADEHDILDKCAYLFGHPDELSRITDAGYQLVHSRHTLKHRDQILQWFLLHQNLAAGDRIVQPSPFGPLTTAANASKLSNWHAESDGRHLALIRQGDARLSKGRYGEAELSYLKCTNYIPWMPEPQLRLALCKLYQGDAKAALSWVMKPLQRTIAEYGAIDADPVEWAYYLISLLCLGKVDEAARRSEQFLWLRHSELDRARWAVSVLKAGGTAPLFSDHAGPRRFSVHQLPDRSFKEWTEQLSVMLRACGQWNSAAIVSGRLSPEAVLCQESREQGKPETAGAEERLRNNRPIKPASIGLFKRGLAYSQARVAAKTFVRDVLHGLETRFGYFLPYRLSRSKNDEFFRVARELTSEECIKAVLMIGAAEGQGCVEAVLAGSRANDSKPVVFCISGSTDRLAESARSGSTSGDVRWYRLMPSPEEEFQQRLEHSVTTIKQENGIDFFDVVFIDGSRFGDQPVGGPVDKEASRARFVLLDSINAPGNHVSYSGLLENRNFALVDHNPGLRNGYAIFRRVESVESDVNATPCLAGALQ
jgi:hypothetical protein